MTSFHVGTQLVELSGPEILPWIEGASSLLSAKVRALCVCEALDNTDLMMMVRVMINNYLFDNDYPPKYLIFLCVAFDRPNFQHYFSMHAGAELRNNVLTFCIVKAAWPMAILLMRHHYAEMTAREQLCVRQTYYGIVVTNENKDFESFFAL